MLGAGSTGRAAASAGGATLATGAAVMASEPPGSEAPGSEDAGSKRAGLVVWVVSLVAGTALFHAMGGGPLAAPPLDPSGWGPWAAGRDPLVASVAVLRLIVLALSWYLVGATSIGIASRVLRAALLIRIADALTLPALRRLLQGALGASLATVMVASALPPPDQGGGEPTTLPLQAADPQLGVAGHESLPVTLTAGGDHGDEVVLEHLDESRPLPLPLELFDRSQNSARPAHAEPPVGTDHLVVPGESFWTIAHDTLETALGRPPSDAETHPYWETLIAANRDRLADADNPDLIFPGQALTLPQPDGAGR